MIRMPQQRAGQREVRMTNQFMGYNHNEIIADGEMFDTKNLSGDGFPVVQPRRKRGISTIDDDVLSGIYYLDGLVYVSGTNVYYKGQIVDGISVSDDENMLPKQIVGMGLYVCIWPDLVYFNTVDQSDCGRMDSTWTAGGNKVTAAMCKKDGTAYAKKELIISNSAPANPKDGQLWMDTSGTKDVLKRYSTSLSAWVEVATTYVKISGKDISKQLNVYDTVNIKKLEAAPGTSTDTKTRKQLEELNGDHIVFEVGANYIVVAGLLNKTMTLNSNTLQVDREIPDMQYVCVANNRVWGCRYGEDRNKARQWSETENNRAVLILSMEDGTEYDPEGISWDAEQPEEPEDGDLWMEIVDDQQSQLMQYDAEGEEWDLVETFIKIAATGIGRDLVIGDTVEIEGCRVPGTMFNQVRKYEIEQMNGKHKVLLAEDDFILVNGCVYGDTLTPGTYSDLSDDGYMRADRRAPDTFVNEIMASKLGDFKNWRSFMGLSTDSYAMSIGEQGEFTGCAVQNGTPVFFKEKSIHKIYGNGPSSFQLNTINSEGVQSGSWRSVQVVNETVYYKANMDVMTLPQDGSMPVKISEALGKVKYTDARAGAANGKYYISMQNNREWSLFCYDIRRRIWYREDDLRALIFATDGNELYAIDETNNRMIGINGSVVGYNNRIEDDLDWTAVFGISGIEYSAGQGGYARSDRRGNQYLSRFDIRMYMEDGAKADMWIMYDSSGEWIHQGTIRGSRLKTFVLPVIPRRCDHLRMKLTGTGEMRIYSISRMMEVGQDG